MQTNAVENNEVILVVDDELALQSLAKVQLESIGYNVFTASNGSEALQVLANGEAIQLMMSDVVMPGMNGFELAEQATNQYPELKVLLVSGYTEKTIAKESQQRFAEHILSKPYQFTELAQRIRQILDEN